MPACGHKTAMPGPDTAVLIDGHYFAYRFFFGMPALSGPGGHPTNVSYAFAELLRRIREDARVGWWAVVFDHRDPSFRHLLYPEYKAHRDPTPPDLLAQLPDVEALCDAFGAPRLSVAGYEADDVLATLAIRLAAAGREVRIATRDKDIDQVLRPGVRTWDPGKDVLRGPEELKAEKGIEPGQVVDYLCMIGDSSDNVPGIRGVGPKTAAKFLAEYGSLSEVLARAPVLSGKTGEAIRAFLPTADLTRTLITLVEVPGLPPDAALAVDRERPVDTAIFARLGFNHARFATASVRSASDGADYRIAAEADLPALAAALRAAGRFAIDTETTGLDPLIAQLVGISLAWGDPAAKQATYIPIMGRDHALVPLAAVRAHLGPVLADPALRKTAQHGKFDQRVLRVQGLPVAGIDGDPMLASWLLDPGRESHGIDGLTRMFLGETKIATQEVADVAGGASMADALVATVARYACEDAQCCWRLTLLLEAKLAEAGLLDVYRGQELPLSSVLAAMEDAGIAVDRSVLARIQAHLQGYLDQVIADIARHAPKLNPASPKQVAALLFDTLGLPVIHRTKSGPSTDAQALEALRHLHELPDLLLQHRALSKLIGTYLARLPDFINPADGRIHTSFRQTGAETGRLSSDSPNLQNIPKKSDLGRELRQAFIPAPRHVFIAADYSQIELRVLAHLADDAALKAAFAAGADIHRAVAAQIAGCAESEVTPRQRSAAKAVNFGVIYGQSAFGLAGQLGIERTEAQRFIDSYFARFSGVAAYVQRVVAEAAARGYACTIAGRRRYIPQLASGNRTERMAGERVALNSTIQGSAADLIKRAMLRCAATLPPGARLILQVHDELIVEAPEALADQAAAALTAAMTGAWTFSVPLIAEARRGASWFDVS